MPYFFYAIVFVFSFTSTAFAISLDEATVQSSVPNDSVQYYKQIEILPAGQYLDDFMTLEVNVSKLKIPKKNLYRKHLGFFLDEENEKFFVSTSYEPKKNILSASVVKTGNYFVGVILPLKKEFFLTRSIDSPQVGEVFTVTSDYILSDAYDLIWDGFPFEIKTSNLELLEDTSHTRTKGGKISFQARFVSPGKASIKVLSRDFPEQSGFATMEIFSTTSVPVFDFEFSQHLWKGMRGKDVERLQQVLQFFDYYHGEISGVYDQATLESVYKFQVDEDIVKTPLNPKTNGTVGEKTRQALNQRLRLPRYSP